MHATMQSEQSDSSLKDLIRNFKEEVKTFVKQEVQLAKTEVSEKFVHLRQNAITLVIGGFLAYAGLIVLIAALGMLLARALEATGLSTALALCAGLGFLALLVVAIGGILIGKALARLKESASVAPDKAIETLKQLRGAESPQRMPDEKLEEGDERKPSSDEIKAGVLLTETLLQDTASEIQRRVSPKYVNQKVKAKFREHPYRWNMVAMVSGVASGFLLKRKFQHQS
jgi:hypothetical protein